ncbi:hypothetical protein TNCV_4807561 [Trichonephila clavipes]|nr:hypothetical protein TNCV_4807561 [Trichonephila clavipes]
MSRSCGQSEARPPVYKFPSKLGTYLATSYSRDERPRAHGIVPGPVFGLPGGRFMIEKSEECSYNQPIENRDVRGAVVLLENSITVQITDQHKRRELITRQLYILNCIGGGWYTLQRSQTVPQKNTPDHD